MSEEKFDPKKFANYKFKAKETLLKVLKPQTAKAASVRVKKRSIFSDTFKVLVAAFIIAALFRTFFIQMFYIPSDSMKPIFSVNDRVLVNKLSYGVGNPLWGAYDTPKLLYVLPNPLYRKAFNLSQKRYISSSLKVPRRGDIIAYKDISNSFYGIKRIVGMPGETFAMKKGAVYINGKPLKENYGTINDKADVKSVKIPQASYYLLGDNRPASSDSRMWGPLPANRIIGVVFMRIWPPARVHTI